MKLTLKHAVAAIILVLSFAAPVAGGPLEDATVVLMSRDYLTAMKLFKPLAENGDAVACKGGGRLMVASSDRRLGDEANRR